MLHQIRLTLNNNGQLNSTLTTNSKGQSESQEFIYAHQQYTFVYDKNMISHLYQMKIKLNGNLVNVERMLWGKFKWQSLF